MKNNELIDLLDLKIFRAVDEPDLSQKFSLAFIDQFNATGIKNVTSTQADWMDNPHCYVLGFYKGDTPVAGARLQLANPDFDYPLTEAFDTVGIDARKFIQNLHFGNHAEACGLWITNRYKGLGLMQFMCGALLSLGQHLGLDRVHAICPRHTLDSLRRLGYVLRSHGHNILEFEYPSKQYTSYLIESDVRTMQFAARKEKKVMKEQLDRSTEIHTSQGRLGDLLIRMNGIPNEPPLSFTYRKERQNNVAKMGKDPLIRPLIKKAKVNTRRANTNSGI